MSVYVDEYDVQNPKATGTVFDDPKCVRVTYRGDGGKRFRVNVWQKPNPIGFGARLPGDKVK